MCAATGHVTPSHHTLHITGRDSAWHRNDRRNAQTAFLFLAFDMFLEGVVGFHSRRAIHAESLESRADADVVSCVLLLVLVLCIMYMFEVYP